MLLPFAAVLATSAMARDMYMATLMHTLTPPDNVDILTLFCHHATNTAVSLVNADPTLLKNDLNVTLHLEPMASFATLSQPLQAMKSAQKLVNEMDMGKEFLGVIGPSYTTVAQSMSVYLSTQSVPHVSSTVASEGFSDKSTYPFFNRGRPSEIEMAPALVTMMKHFGWQRIATMVTRDTYGDTIAQTFEQAIANDDSERPLTIEAAYQYPVTRFFDRNSEEYWNARLQIRQHLKNFRERHLRVLMLHCTVDDETAVYDELMEAKMLDYKDASGNWVRTRYVIVGTTDWTSFLMLQGKRFPNLINLAGVAHNDANAATLNAVMQQVFAGLQQAAPDKFPSILTWQDMTGSMRFMTETCHDAVFAYTHALRRVTNTSEGRTAFDGHDRVALGTLMNSELRGKQGRFRGASGWWELDNNGDRTVTYQFEQWREIAYPLGTTMPIALVGENGSYTPTGETPWEGRTVPTDGPVLESTIKAVPTGLVVVCFIFAAIGLALTLWAFYFINKHRALRYIRMGSPNMQCVQLVGIMMGFVAMFIYHLDSARLDNDVDSFKSVCAARDWMPRLSFALAYGALLAKIWRVSRIFNADLQQVSISDGYLMRIVAGIVVVFAIVLTAFQGSGWYEPKYTTINEEFLENSDVLLTTLTEKCDAPHLDAMKGVLDGLQAVMLIVGIYLSITLKSIEIPALNDSQDVRTAIYFTSGFTVVCTTTLYLISDTETLPRYVLEVMQLWLVFMSMLGVLFVPRILIVMTGRHEQMTQSLTGDLGSRHSGKTRSTTETTGASKVAGSTRSTASTSSDIAAGDRRKTDSTVSNVEIEIGAA